MNVDEFVINFRNLAPEADLLLQAGYDPEQTAEYLATFACLPRENEVEVGSEEDEMLKLVARWQAAKLVIGPLNLLDVPIITSDYIQVGVIELDPLAYRRREKDYVLLDGAERSPRVWPAAPNGSALLDVLCCVRRYYVQTSTDQIDIDDEEIGLRFKAECLAMLGGETYLALPEQLLGW